MTFTLQNIAGSIAVAENLDKGFVHGQLKNLHAKGLIVEVDKRRLNNRDPLKFDECQAAKARLCVALLNLGFDARTIRNIGPLMEVKPTGVFESKQGTKPFWGEPDNPIFEPPSADIRRVLESPEGWKFGIVWYRNTEGVTALGGGFVQGLEELKENDAWHSETQGSVKFATLSIDFDTLLHPFLEELGRHAK